MNDFVDSYPEGIGHQLETLAAPDSRPSNMMQSISEMTKGLDYYESEGLFDEIYHNYSTAIRRRNREPLPYESFVNHFLNGGNHYEPCVFGSASDGYLLGNNINGVFVPTHFAPTGILGGYRLIKDAVGSSIPTAMFLTDDLVTTIAKMDGWKVLPIHVNVRFRDQLVRKTMVVNNWSAFTKLATHYTKRSIHDRTAKISDRVRALASSSYGLIDSNRSNIDNIEGNLSRVFEPDSDSDY